MASRKQLKKSIKYITSELFADCVVLSKCEPANTAKYEDLMVQILALATEYVARLSHTERGSERLFYKTLVAEFTDKANAISDEIVKA